jgi:hypothetical protein
LVVGSYEIEEFTRLPPEVRARVEEFTVAGSIASENWICMAESSATPV